jgi:hypothetical protein
MKVAMAILLDLVGLTGRTYDVALRVPFAGLPYCRTAPAVSPAATRARSTRLGFTGLPMVRYHRTL